MRQRQLAVLLWLYGLTATGLFAFGVVVDDGKAMVLAAANVLVVVGLAWLRRQGRLTTPSVVICLALLATGVYAMATSPGGLLDTALILVVFGVAMAALLLDRGWLIALTALAVAAVAAVGIRDPLGLIDRPQPIAVIPTDLALATVVLLLTAFVIHRQQQFLWLTLDRAVRHEAALLDSNEALREQSDRARASEQRWRALVEAAPQWVLHLDRDRRIRFANRPGLRRHEGPLPAGDFADLFPPARREDVVATIDATLARGQVAELETDLEERDERRRCLCRIAPLHGPAPLEGLIVLVDDITDWRRLQDRLLQTQKLESVGQLAGGIAHDFNNLLTVIIGYADLATERLGQGDPVDSELEQIRRAGERARDLTRRILAFSRRQPVHVQPVDLREKLAELGPMLTRLIGETVELAIVPDPATPRVEADPGQIEQVILNLVINARDAIAARPGDGARRIAVRTGAVRVSPELARQLGGLAPGLCAELTVSDTGTGIPERLRNRIFEPFFTTKEPGQGTGLGLATVYGVVTQAGGAIAVDSGVDRGTTFRIYWPADVREDGAPANAAGVADDDLRGQEHVLVVEDDPAVRHFVRSALTELGYRVSEAATGEAALARLDDEPDIDLVVSDVVMPGLDGIELRRRVADRVPVLLTSGYADMARPSDQPITAAEFLQKPFTTRDLAARVRRLLEARLH